MTDSALPLCITQTEKLFQLDELWPEQGKSTQLEGPGFERKKYKWPNELRYGNAPASVVESSVIMRAANYHKLKRTPRFIRSIQKHGNLRNRITHDPNQLSADSTMVPENGCGFAPGAPTKLLMTSSQNVR